MLRNDVHLYRFCGALYHVKLLVVDDLWVSIGSSNFDTRSFRLNDEMNINVLDREFAKQQIDIFEKDKVRSHLVTLEAWQSRNLYEKTRDRLATLLRSQL